MSENRGNEDLIALANRIAADGGRPEVIIIGDVTIFMDNDGYVESLSLPDRLVRKTYEMLKAYYENSGEESDAKRLRISTSAD